MTGTILNGGNAVTTQAQLDAAITVADGEAANSGAYEIDLGGNIALTSELAAIALNSGVTLDIEGGNFTLDGGSQYRGLFIQSGAVSVNGLNIDNTLAQGGTGGFGYASGGGGAGLGGGLFVGAGASVSLSNVAFNGDSAVGGNAGT
ncbi:MAG TPA: hypothetical protein VFC47_11595, partial [Caulobacteraceae bacterium]|nr:hypothetical protein [Caulobacteraceae bacterium]